MDESFEPGMPLPERIDTGPERSSGRPQAGLYDARAEVGLKQLVDIDGRRLATISRLSARALTIVAQAARGPGDAFRVEVSRA